MSKCNILLYVAVVAAAWAMVVSSGHVEDDRLIPTAPITSSDAEFKAISEDRFVEVGLWDSSTCAQHAGADRNGDLTPNIKEALRECVGTTGHEHALWFPQSYDRKVRRLVVFPDPAIDRGIHGDWGAVVTSGVVEVPPGAYRNNAHARATLQDSFRHVHGAALEIMERFGKTTIHEAICCNAGRSYKCLVQAVASIINRCVSHYGGSWQVAKGAMPNCGGRSDTPADIIAAYDARCGVGDPDEEEFVFKNGMGCPVIDRVEADDDDAEEEAPVN